MNWVKEEPFDGIIFQGCATCPPVEKIAAMDMVIAVGFGTAQVTKDNEIVYSEDPQEEGEYPTLARFEEMAKADPGHDWRVLLIAPLRDREYQRHGDSEWVLIHSGRGFA